MGASATATIAYGIYLPEYPDALYEKYDEEIMGELDPGDLGQMIALARGLDMFDWVRCSELERESPVELHGVGHYEGDSYALTLKGTEIRTNYDAENFDPSELLANQAVFKRASAVRYCAENGLPDFSLANWMLYPNYG